MRAPPGIAAERGAIPLRPSPLPALATKSGAADQGGRIEAIDLFRGIATIVMIFAHAANALLGADFRHGWIWQQINLLFGFVAPAFLLLSGAGLRLALERHAAGTSVPRDVLRRYGRRAITILLVGYWLQIPVLSLRQIIYCHRPSDLARLFDANILQIIGVAQLLALLFIPLLQTRRGRTAFGIIAAMTIGLLSPYCWSGAWYCTFPLPFSPYLAPQPLTTFPLLPFGAHFFLGFAGAAALIALLRSRGPSLRMIGIGAAAIATGLGLDHLLVHLPPHNDFWGSSAQHLLFRAGGVILGFGLIGSLQPSIPSALRRATAFAGRSSLAVYVLHLMVIYGSPVNMGLHALMKRYQPSGLTPIEVCAVAVLTCTLILTVIRFWQQLAADHRRSTLWMKWGWWALFWGLFLSIP